MKPLLIAIAGPYSASTEEGRARNLARLNEAALALLRRGHIPVIGVNAALPAIEGLAPEERYEGIMRISLGVVGRCDALLMLGESPGANRERDLVAGRGLPIYHRIEDIPGPIDLPSESPRIYHEPGTGTLESWALDTSEDALHRLLRDLFVDHWSEIVFGPLIQGSAWEIEAKHPPERFVLLDGYLTVDYGYMHCHLCIGEHRGDDDAPTDPALARHRRVARAEMYRRINRDGTPDTWGVRLFNGHDEQMITILLPSPFLTHDLKFRDEPAWDRLALWDHLRRTYLGLEPDPRDRSGHRMIYP